MKLYGEAAINEAIRRVETAKQNHPRGWRFLRELALPGDSLVAYAFANADANAARLSVEDLRAIYAVAWLNGLAVGVALGEQSTEGRTDDSAGGTGRAI